MGIFSSKKKIDMSTSTLSQAIMLKCQKKDFSYKSETKILTLIYEHVKYNRVKGQCQHNGRNTNLVHALLLHFLTDAGINNTEDPFYRPLGNALAAITGRIYFCEEITKSIAILTNPALITNGQRRELVLALLRSIKVEEDNRLRREIANVAPILYPDTRRHFVHISEAERQRFISSLTTKIIDHVKNNHATRLRSITYVEEYGNDVIRNRIEDLRNQVATQRFPVGPRRAPRAPVRRNSQIQQEPVISERDTSHRNELHKQLALLFSHMDQVRELSPGDKITVYEYESEYYLREECVSQNIPMDSGPIVLEYMNENEYLNKCDAFKKQFTAVLPQIHIMV
ncbi:hypothetical protein [Ewingella americana]